MLFQNVKKEIEMKILNLDKIGKNEERTLVLAGKSYKVNEMTVSNFIETTRAAEKITESSSIADQIIATVDLITRSIPDVDRAVLEQLSLEQLQIVVAYARGDDVVGAVSDTPVATKTGEGEQGN